MEAQSCGQYHTIVAWPNHTNVTISDSTTEKYHTNVMRA